MSLPDPVPGMVLRYAFLWSHEEAEGLEEGDERPCAVVLTNRTEEGELIVFVLPITRRPPDDLETAIEIPPKIKSHLGLDQGVPSWVILTETNRFGWPGMDLRPVPNQDEWTPVYGMLPPKFFEQIRQKVLAIGRAKDLRTTSRN